MAEKRGGCWFRLTIVAALLLVWGLLLYKLTIVPVGLQHDETFNLLDVVSVLNGQHPIYFPANFGREPLFVYSVVLVVKYLSGLHFIWDLRFAGIAWAFLGIVLAVPLALELSDRKSAAIAVPLMGVSFWFLFTARVGLRAIVLLPFSEAFVYLLVRGSRTKKTWAFLLAGVFGGASIYTYLASRVLFGVPVVFAIYWAWKSKRGEVGRRIAGVLMTLLVMAAVSLPLYSYGRTHPMDRRIGELGHALNALEHGDFRPALRSSAETLESLLWKGMDRPHYQYNVPFRPALQLPLAALWLVGLAFALRNAAREEDFVLLTMLLIGLLPDLLTTGGPLYLRGMIALPYVFLLVGEGTGKVISWMGRHGRRWTVAAVCAMVLLFAWHLWDSGRAYFDKWAKAAETYEIYNGDLRAVAMVPPEKMAGRVFVSADFWMDIDQQTYLFYRPRRRDVDWFNADLAMPLDTAGTATYFFTISSPGTRDVITDAVHAGASWDVQAFYGSANLARATTLSPSDAKAVTAGLRMEPLRTPVSFGKTLRLLAGVVSVDGGRAEVSTLWQVTGKWQGHAPPRITVGIFDADGTFLWAHRDDLVGFAYQDWRNGDRFLQFTDVSLPSDIPPGRYDVRVGLYATPGRLLPMLAGENYLGVPPRVAELRIAPGASTGGQPPVPPMAFDSREGGGLLPVGLWNRPAQIVAGVPVSLWASWKSEKDLAGVKFEVTLTSPGGEAIWSGRAESNAPADWPRGRVYRLHHSFVPEVVPRRAISVTLRLCAHAEGRTQGCGSIEGIRLVSPHRVMSLERKPQHGVDAVFGGILKLVGYDLHPANGGVKLVLYWKVLARPSTRLKRFVHVLDGNGRIVAQNDAFVRHPEQIPFSAWVAGEYMIDTVEIGARPSPGQTIEIGVYDPNTGKRLHAISPNAEIVGDALRVRIVR